MHPKAIADADERAPDCSLKKFVRTLRNHEDLLMNYFKAGKLSTSGIAEVLNLRINLCMRKAYVYRSSVSYAWKTPGAEIHPQILLKSPFFR